MTQTTESFYADLPSTPDFAAVADLSGYAPAPADWSVLLTDVIGSTKAIQAGRYKDVNMVGAACITAALNALPGYSLPFVFGGDGATILVPPAGIETGKQAMLGLAGLAQQQFGLGLRVGVVPVTELHARSASLGVRKLQLSPGNDLALFSGDGLELADTLVKDSAPDNPFAIPIPASPPAPDLEGLSCRWEPLRAARGVSLTLMLRAMQAGNAAQEAALRSTLTAIRGILRDNPAANAAPARAETMRFRWPPRNLWMEARATTERGSIVRRFLRIFKESIFQAIAERFDLKLGPYNAPAYRAELRANTDFRKYDGLLRLVLDVSPDQADAIEGYLAAEHTAGRLVYGTHRADAALMTCLVFSLEQSQHIHFIDGDDGGFALAAQQFKQQLAAQATQKHEGNG